MNKYIKAITNGVITKSPILVPLLGMCSTLTTITSAASGLSMGLATIFVFIYSNAIVSLPKRFIPNAVRIPAFIVVIAGFTAVLQMVIKTYTPALDQSLGIFMSPIMVNYIVLRRAESIAPRSSVGVSLFDGVDIGLGFTIGLTLLATVREMLGGGTFPGMRVYPGDFSALLFVLPPRVFITPGPPIGIYHTVTRKQ